jgi:hypothetical protein
MRWRTAHNNARRKRQIVPTYRAGRGIWLAEQPGYEGFSCLIDGRSQPAFYRSYR